MKIYELKIEITEEIPSIKLNGILYYSPKYEIAIHLCACGCGQQSVTPIKQGEWNISEQNGLYTLRPSIGNFKGENPFHAHYFITHNKIEWC